MRATPIQAVTQHDAHEPPHRSPPEPTSPFESGELHAQLRVLTGQPVNHCLRLVHARSEKPWRAPRIRDVHGPYWRPPGHRFPTQNQAATTTASTIHGASISATPPPPALASRHLSVPAPATSRTSNNGREHASSATPIPCHNPPLPRRPASSDDDARATSPHESSEVALAAKHHPGGQVRAEASMIAPAGRPVVPRPEDRA